MRPDLKLLLPLLALLGHEVRLFPRLHALGREGSVIYGSMRKDRPRQIEGVMICRELFPQSFPCSRI